MLVNKSKHLSKEEQIRLGSFYTPDRLVRKVYEPISPYIRKNKKVVIFDNAAGCGAFIFEIKGYDYRVADYDIEAVNFLKKNLDKKKVFYGNSLVDVCRKKYKIPNDAFLIQVGNPPYNDTTSEYKKGKKGKNECDPNLFDRDLGISFLKSYDKLKSDLVCILHPLSYLIKEANFKRLKSFRENYKLIKGVIFSSSWFTVNSSAKFPIVIALYERKRGGMSFDYIKNFNFSVLDSDEKFTIAKFETTDGFIDKYPPRKNDIKVSPIGLYYYTFRDLNSLRRNASFINRQHYNGIVVNVKNFYKYAYLYALKELFDAEKLWLYSNLSPLINRELLEKNKKDYVEYAIQSSPVVKNIDKKAMKEIIKYYHIGVGKLRKPEYLEKKILKQFNRLI